VARDRPVPRRDHFRQSPSGGRSKGAKAIWRNLRASSRLEFSGTGFMANPFEFLQQVRSEATKVTWPTRRETLITTALVVLMVIVASIFFIAVDQTIRIVLGFILSLGR
jgi:preprotein translocase subunit SecE